MELPRYVVPRDLADGRTAYYFNTPKRLRQLKCPVSNEPLGTDYAQMIKRAEMLNGMLDEWSAQRKGLPVTTNIAQSYGTVDWLFREYKQSDAYLKNVAPRSRQNYEWAMDEICNIVTKRGDRVGCRLVKTITSRGADKLTKYFNTGKQGQKRLRTGHKLMMLCRKAWKVVYRLYPSEFDKAVPNPWMGATLERRVITQKAAVTRDQVYSFAYGAIEEGEIEAAAVAVICFEWLQRPENVIAGHIKWSGYRSGKPIIRIDHHKTGATVDHPLEEMLPDGTVVKFYEDAEAILAKLPRRGISMILREIERGKSKPFAFPTMQHKVQRLRKKLGLPAHFTFDACRHGGMTELEEAELTEGQGRALSAHRTSQAYAGYAKRTERRMLSATRKRHAHRIADENSENESSTSVRNGHLNRCRNDTVEQRKISE